MYGLHGPFARSNLEESEEREERSPRGKPLWTKTQSFNKRHLQERQGAAELVHDIMHRLQIHTPRNTTNQQESGKGRHACFNVSIWIH